ncbi:MAG: cysteine--tRNA ligase [Clostridiales bacterium]|nr:cysteine--tRNA ligase [Clostridiales bacterium]
MLIMRRVTFDTLRRYLEYRGYEVTFVQNFTDIDDKMIKRANEEGITVDQLADRFIKEYYVDADGLNIERQSAQPRATHSIKAIIALIKSMEEQGFTYVIEGDGVYYDVSKKEDYGKLSHYKLDELVAGGGERKASYEGKKNPGDFAVWKFKKEGEPAWGSPWGEGRPGWHIECSAMIKQYLGDTIDIHGGGQDLIFPHHENEIAQSEAANGCPLANFWVHNAFVNIDGEKMSKSLGNFFTIRDIVKKYPYNVIRFFILLGHYRSPINFSDELLAAAQTSLGRISNCVSQIKFALENGADAHSDDSETSAKLRDAVKAAEESFIAHMDDDLNSADAITDIFNLVTEANKAIAADDASAAALKLAGDKIVELTGVLGVTLDEEKEEIPAEVMELAEKRAQAKKAKDFSEADKIRDQITALGYSIKDTPKGPQLEKIK